MSMISLLLFGVRYPLTGRRNTGETSRNERSSRSHVLFIIHIESRSNSSNRSLCSSLCIVDLAGSENALLSQVSISAIYLL